MNNLEILKTVPKSFLPIELEKAILPEDDDKLIGANGEGFLLSELEYLKLCANNFPEALELIERLANTNHDVEDLSKIIIDSIKFMKSLENDTN